MFWGVALWRIDAVDERQSRFHGLLCFDLFLCVLDLLPEFVLLFYVRMIPVFYVH